MNEKEIALNKKIMRGRMINIILIFAIIAIVGFVAFTMFRINTDARHMLREGKNVLTGLNMLNIEYYGYDKSIYDPNKWNGLADGVVERLNEINGVEGNVILTEYKFKTREIRGFIYERDNYRVTYSYDSKGKTSWQIDYIFNYLTYEVEPEE